jgi:predicted transcriptional regulator YheO
MSTHDSRALILREASKVAEAVAKTFAPLCEVVVHDLTNPDHAILAIHNNMSGREVGGPATELGLARIQDPNFPDQLINYDNRFPDGRAVKSTSIGLRDSDGNFVAALCINIDLSYLRSVGAIVSEFARSAPLDSPRESLARVGIGEVETEVGSFAARLNKDPRALNSDEKRLLIRQLERTGHLQMRGATERVATMLAVSRSSIYYYLQDDQSV